MRPFVRRPIGRGGLIGTAARTAVVAGTATAVVGGMQRRQRARDDEAADAAAYDAQQQQLAMRAAAEQAVDQQARPTSADPTIAALDRLVELQRQGVLSDEEFSAAKSKLLGL
jgi:hypothetical protein